MQYNIGLITRTTVHMDGRVLNRYPATEPRHYKHRVSPFSVGIGPLGSFVTGPDYFAKEAS